MKSSKATRKAKPGGAVAVATAPAPRKAYWPYAVGLLAAIFAVFEVYWPAINGPFLLDDSYLPYMLPGYVGLPLSGWVGGLRPLLMFTFWLTTRARAARRRSATTCSTWFCILPT